MSKELTPQEEQEIVNKMNEKISELEKESAEIDYCRGKGVTLDKSIDLGERQREIEKELSQLKSTRQPPQTDKT